MDNDTSQQPVSFKDTLNLPHTDFPIRPNAAVDDPELLKRWQQEELYQKTFNLNAGKEKYILHDGPPYANGNIHLGHAYNKIIKDIITKSQRMSGKHVPMIPGWDCHGLPIEYKVSKDNLGATRAQLKKACREYAQHWINAQRVEFKRLGVLMDWEHPYETMNYHYEASILRAFGKFVEQGYIQRKNKTVPWCFHCQTVLATAEIEYKDRKDPSIYVLFPLAQQDKERLLPSFKDKNVSLLIWTTTPWTLPLNRAVFIHPKSTYDLIEHNGSYVIIGSTVAQKLCATINIPYNKIATIAAQDLAKSQAHHPFIQDFKVPVLADDFVSLEDGTACVHSAPGCGPEDYEMGVKYGLEIFSPLAADGTYTYGVQPAELIDKSITDGQIWVIKKLAELNALFFKTSIKHSFPHCWRCHNGLMFRATRQWFCDLSQNNLRDRALKAIDQTQFVPERSANFLRATIQNRLEWCLSRQRVWGVPITAVLCKNNDSAFISPGLVEKVARGVEKEGTDYWDRVSVDELIPASMQCTECGSTEFIKETDILDVWFDSGISHYAVLKQNKNLRYPADLYIEGVDQHRGWFQSSLLTSLVLETEPCFKAVATHGFTVDEQGRKMSKSLGNGVEPDQLIEQLGTDGLRLWASTISFEGDAVVSPVLLNNVKEVYRRIRNTCRFLLSNINDFDIKRDAVKYDELLAIDRYALARLQELNATIRAAYATYDITAVFHALGSYCASDLSSLYLDIIKDRLYTEKAHGPLRRSAQTACWYILDTLTHLIAPVLSFTAEQISDHYQKNKKESIHLQPFSSLEGFPKLDNKDVQEWAVIFELRSALLKAIEEQREKGLIKHSLEAKIILGFDSHNKNAEKIINFLKYIQSLGQSDVLFLKDMCIVSQLEWASSHEGLEQTSMPGVYVRVVHADGVKCPRCWQWDITQEKHGLCNRCQRVLGIQR